MIYLDSSVALAHLFAENRRPPAALWEGLLVSSRLLQYEVWNRLHAHKLGARYRTAAQALIEQVDLLDLSPTILSRALDPFPIPPRTLDGLHLASMEHLRSVGESIELASYDERLLASARSLGIPLAQL